MFFSAQECLAGDFDLDAAAHLERKAEETAPDAAARGVAGGESRRVTDRRARPRQGAELSCDGGLNGHAEPCGDHPHLYAALAISVDPDDSSHEESFDRSLVEGTGLWQLE